jgi:hypothetical protein
LIDFPVLQTKSEEQDRKNRDLQSALEELKKKLHTANDVATQAIDENLMENQLNQTITGKGTVHSFAPSFLSIPRVLSRDHIFPSMRTANRIISDYFNSDFSFDSSSCFVQKKLASCQ